MTLLVPNLPDRYEILGKLGSGGMGTVYKVHDKVLDLDVALKVLNVGTGGSDEHIVRFNKEARACAKLKHPNIINIIDFGFFHGVTPYMVLEYVEGKTLKQHLTEVGPLSVEEANSVFAQIISALAHAHAQKIIHRDLKPSNILVTEKNDTTLIKLFDFGIARITEDGDAMRLTRTNAFMGSPSYMSPEQIKIETIDVRSDIYSFGCVMFEALTGRLPFISDEMLTLIDLQLHEPAPKLGDYVRQLEGSTLETVVDRCLKKNPVDRFQSATEISKYFQLKPVSASEYEPSIPLPALPNTGEKAILVVAVILIVILAGTISAPFLTNNNQEDTTNTAKPEVKTKSPTTADKKKRRALILSKGVLPDHPYELHLSNIPQFQESDIKLIPNDGSIYQLDLSGPKFGRDKDSMTPDTLSEEGFEHVSKLSAITIIKLHGGEVVSRKSISSLAKLPHLRGFDANRTTFEDISSVSQLKNLRYAEFSFLTPSELAAALKGVAIENLVLRDTAVNAETFSVLSSLKTLKILGLSTVDIENSKGILLLNKLPSLEVLTVESTSSVAKDEVIAQLVGLKRIKRMSLKKSNIEDQHLKQIAAMTSLDHLFLDGNIKLTGKGLMYLLKLPSLKLLDVSNCIHITEQDVKDFIRAENKLGRNVNVITNFNLQITKPLT